MRVVVAKKADTFEQAHRAIKRGLALWGVAALIVIAGIYWFGMCAMFETDSPDFIPIADFFAFALAMFGAIQIGQGLLYRARYRKYGASTLEAGPAVLGRKYQGRIRTEVALEVTGPYTIHLLCESQAPTSAKRKPPGVLVKRNRSLPQKMEKFSSPLGARS